MSKLSDAKEIESKRAPPCPVKLINDREKIKSDIKAFKKKGGKIKKINIGITKWEELSPKERNKKFIINGK